MKEFRKTENCSFICEECGKIYETLNGLRVHVQRSHTTKIYHDKWLKEDFEGKCKTCGNETKFKGILSGYYNCCSKKCVDTYRYEQNKKTNLKFYGVENNYQRVDVKEKNKKLCKERYGHENPAHGTNKEKVKKTMLSRYNSEYAFQNKNCREKFENTMLLKYGHIYPLQNTEIFIKASKSNINVNSFKNTDIWYQGSYELDFLEKYYNIFPDIIRGPSIKYIYKNEQKIYYPDFLIPSLNLIVECKNSYLLKRDTEILKEKKKAIINNGYNYIIIVNKDYSEFNNFSIDKSENPAFFSI